MNLNYTQTALPPDVAQRVNGEAHMVELIQEVLKSAPNEDARLFTGIAPADLLAIEAGVGVHLLSHAALRFPINNAMASSAMAFKRGVAAQILDALEAMARVQPVAWRVVAAKLNRSYVARWSREPTGLSVADVTKEDETVKEGQAVQLTKPREVKDPVLVLEIALAETTAARPVDDNFEKNGKRTSSRYSWIEGGAKLSRMPPQMRKQRDAAVAVLRSMYPEVGEVGDVPLTDEQIERAKKFLGLGLSVAEVAGAIGAPDAKVAALVEQAKKAKEDV